MILQIPLNLRCLNANHTISRGLKVFSFSGRIRPQAIIFFQEPAPCRFGYGTSVNSESNNVCIVSVRQSALLPERTIVLT